MGDAMGTFEAAYVADNDELTHLPPAASDDRAREGLVNSVRQAAGITACGPQIRAPVALPACV